MSVAPRIALRYLFSRKSHSAVNVISAVSVAGVALAVAAMVVVLSVFNGFHSLIASRLGELDPQLKVEMVSGRAFDNADSLAAVISELPGVAAATPTVEQRALAVWGDVQTPVRVKGVDPVAYAAVAQLDSVIIDGEPWLDFHPAAPSAILSVGVANALRASVGSSMLLRIYAPRRVGRISVSSPLTAFRADSVAISAVFAVNQPEFDTDIIYVPLDVARDLFQYVGQATAIEVALAPGVNEDAASAAVAEVVGQDFSVRDSMSQHASSFRIVNVEKWMSFLLLALIMVIASFNIISTMALLIIEKESNAFTLSAIGASPRLIRAVYAIEGFGVTMGGGIIGIVLGAAFCIGQARYGWVKLAGDSSGLSIMAYPVEFHAVDMLPILLTTLVIASVTALYAIFASRK
ncbi:MAG: ABC transporter permease [Muribaculaceae bacterium]|nr:ABC transporter permease [Muribaculaceae bacterium]